MDVCCLTMSIALTDEHEFGGCFQSESSEMEPDIDTHSKK